MIIAPPRCQPPEQTEALCIWAKTHYQQIQAYLSDAFKANIAASKIIRQHARAIEALLIALWPNHLSQHSLIATGGFGRRELHPLPISTY